MALAAAALAAIVINPVEQKVLPLSEEAVGTLESSVKINESFEKLEAFRSENAINTKSFDAALYDIQTKKRSLVEDYQSSPSTFVNGATINGQITERDISRAEQAVDKYRGAVLILTQNSGNWGGVGTAFRISPDLVLTNAHNIGAMNGSLASGIKFKLIDINGIEHEVSFLGADGLSDIALLRLDKPNYDLPYFSMDRWTTGYTKDEIVVSVGHPALLGYWTPTIGVTPIGNLTQSDENGNAAISALATLNITSGASGSPVFDLDGRLEGIIFSSTVNSFEAGSKNGYKVSPYLESYSITTYSLAYDFKAKVIAWTK